jgi:hypothetical protein
MGDRIGRVEAGIGLFQAFLLEAQIEKLIARFRQKEGINGLTAKQVLIVKSETNRTEAMMTNDPPTSPVIGLNHPTVGRAAWRLVPDGAHLIQGSRVPSA